MLVRAWWIREQFVGANTPPRDPPANKAAERREHYAVYQELTCDPPAAGSECDADGDFVKPADRARQLQIREIGAGDPKHKSNRAPNRTIQRGGMGTNKCLMEIRHVRLAISIGHRVSAFQPPSDGGHFSLGAPQRTAVRNAADSEPEITRLTFSQTGSWNQRHPQVHPVLREIKSLRNHSNHSGRGAVQPYGLADHGRIHRVSPLPEAVSQNGHCLRPALRRTPQNRARESAAGRSHRRCWR